MSRNYETVGGSTQSTPWDPRATEKNGFHFKAGDDKNNVMEGYYVEKADIMGKENKTFAVHKIHEVLSDGTMGTIWGTSGGMVLDERMDNVPIGSFIRLEYTGRKHKKGIPPTNAMSQTNSFHTWDVKIDRNAVPYNQLTGKTLTVKKDAAPANNGTGNPLPPAINTPVNFSSRGGSGNNATAPAVNSQPFDADSDLPF